MCEASASYLPPPAGPQDHAVSSPPRPRHRRPPVPPSTTTGSHLESTAPTLGQSLNNGIKPEPRPLELHAPPTPLALPGAWSGSTSSRTGVQRSRSEGDGLRWRLRWRSNIDDEQDGGSDSDDGALLLPPPYLADDSPRESFDGASALPTLPRARRPRADIRMR